jgi:hypothetical protein
MHGDLRNGILTGNVSVGSLKTSLSKVHCTSDRRFHLTFCHRASLQNVNFRIQTRSTHYTAPLHKISHKQINLFRHSILFLALYMKYKYVLLTILMSITNVPCTFKIIFQNWLNLDVDSRSSSPSLLPPLCSRRLPTALLHHLKQQNINVNNRLWAFFQFHSTILILLFA